VKENSTLAFTGAPPISNTGYARKLMGPEAGHLSPVERPGEFNEAILVFLDRHGL
jgi:hypothetical protein